MIFEPAVNGVRWRIQASPVNWVDNNSIFIDDFWISSQLGLLMIPCINCIFIFTDEFGLDSDSIFIDDFWFNSELCLLVIPYVSREFVFADDFWFDSDSDDFWSSRELC